MFKNEKHPLDRISFWDRVRQAQTLAIASTLFLIFSYVMVIGGEIIGLRACPLCHIERWALVGQALFCSTLSLISTRLRIIPPRLISSFLSLTWAGLAGLFLYHLGIQWMWWSPPAFCQADIHLTLSALFQKANTPCKEITFSFLGWPAPLWMSASCLFWAGLCAFAFFIPSRAQKP